MLHKTLNHENEKNWFWSIALFSLFIEVAFHSLLPLSISNDSYGYISLSQHIFKSGVAFERAVGYPLFLGLFGMNLFDSFTLVLLAQAAMSVVTPLIIFKTLKRFGLTYAVLGSLIGCLYFYNYAISLYILTEPLFVFSTAVYIYYVMNYFYNQSIKNLSLVILSCWFINFVRLSGSQYFLVFILGVGCNLVLSMWHKDFASGKAITKHILVGCLIFLTSNILYNSITNRTSTMVWPHFVFNWVYRVHEVLEDPVPFKEEQRYYGIIHPDNGPAATALYDVIAETVRENPHSFDRLKSGGSQTVKDLSPESDGKYSPEAVRQLMQDLLYNNAHIVRSWWIEGALMARDDLRLTGTMLLLRKAIIESFIKYPEVLLHRSTVVARKIRDFLVIEIIANNVTLATAYHQQIPKVVDSGPDTILKAGMYKQWVSDLYEHTGHDPVNTEFDYSYKYPTTIQGAAENIKTDNLIGFGHYVVYLGMQVLRLCWLFLIIGVLMLPFVKQKHILFCMLCASIIPPFMACFVSEIDPRQLLMSSPVQIVTAIYVCYLCVQVVRQKAHRFSQATVTDNNMNSMIL